MIELALFNLCGLAIAVLSSSIVTGEPDRLCDLLDELDEEGDW